MGGAAMACLIEAVEQWMGKPLLWSTIQFLNHGMLGESFDIKCEKMSGGQNVQQVSSVLMRGETKLQQMIAAVGARDGESDRQFVTMPDILSPDKCPQKKDDTFARPGNLLSQFERRTALEDSDQGVEYMWIRPRFETQISAALLALISDFFLGAHIRTRQGTSLDNTFRLAKLTQTDWVLCVTQLGSFTRGAAHGMQYLYAEDGTLLATSSQTGLLPRK